MTSKKIAVAIAVACGTIYGLTSLPANTAEVTIRGASCDSSTNEDVFGGLTFKTSHPINETDYRSALVRKAAFHQSHPETGADGKDIVVEVVARIMQ